MARLALFNILANSIDWEETDVLDLFSGTGGISFECLSRGARSATSADVHAACVRYQIGVAEQLGIKNFRALRQDVFRMLKKNRGEQYSLIFADPPYSHASIAELPGQIFGTGWLQPDGLFILEHPGTLSFKSVAGFSEQRTYGSVNFTFFKQPIP